MNPYDFYITPEEFEQAAKNGISQVIFYNRVRQLGWSKDKAMTTPPRKRASHNNRWVKIAERNGICYRTYTYRVNRLGWEPERAATQPLQDRKALAKVMHEATRKYPEHYKRLAEANGIKERTFHRRLSSGWDIERAATQPPMTSREIGLMTKDKRSRGLKRFFLKKRKPMKEG
ncbi:hypothetical protein [Paenibacillus thermotolerans]|uniref:hypothetical protein n=1 Tax=Paenibacillus thermotolerans TaxID=3027807 RepID=UPI0023677E68|nr:MULTISPECIES: hypothetical protein [unclassified Paenibacillus]